MAAEALREGTILHGEYCIQSVIGSGGSAVIYQATCAEMRVILKECFVPQWMARQQDGRIVPLPGQEQEAQAAWERFAQEGQYLAVLRDVPGVGQLLEQFRENGTQYLVLEEQPGISLREYRKTNALGPEETVRLMLPVIDILGEVHRRQVLHLDFNPDNILIERDGTPHLLDFGSACFLGKRPDLVQAESAYSAIELYDSSPLSPAADVYSVCAVLYEALTGRAPESALERLFLDELSPSSTLNPAISPALSDVLLRGLALDPQERYAAMDELSEALRVCLAGVQAHRRRKRWEWVITISTVLCSALLWLFLWEPPAWYETQKTQTFSIRIDYRMSETLQQETETELNRRLTEFAGTDYLLRRENGYWVATVPYACFQGEAVDQVIQERFTDFGWIRRLQTYLQPQVDWSEAEAVPEFPWIVTVYTSPTEISSPYAQASRMDLQLRMDSLPIPHLVGVPGNAADQAAVAVSPADYDPVVMESVGSGGRFSLDLPIGSEDSIWLSRLTVGDAEPIQENGETGIALTLQETWNKEALFRLSSLALEEETKQIVIRYDTVGALDPLFTCEVEAPIVDGEIALSLCEGQRQWLPDYLCATLLETDTVEPLYPHEQYYLEQPVDAYQNVNPASYLYQPPGTDPCDTAAEAIQMLGITTAYVSAQQTLCMFLEFPLDEDLPALSIACLQRIAALPEVQQLECPVAIQVLAPEETDASYLVVLYWENGRQYAELQLQGKAMAPYQTELQALWTEDVLGEPYKAILMP